ncbi:phosphate starvation-inducible protein PhoH [Bordetella trematum]|uniref:PhoH-like protein n=1 Tax=Bordetella trematum TaxID=123899 RepID=A0A157NZ33_9BORD|nr:PhoH family protein [Bordetella trematum]AUL47604.1 phosphate starvation-inducible protein PhoH [Bordetella trematum]AZR94466.1 phosphate starvation-inducible protein PhoH [Bordetella trematum]NNH20750.1 PhoH family protein [Bordetella trematum]QIM73026.1 PhoH family protein [Bordetella trematum]SAI26632.1 PhoH-like protein [Bordetella trematum]
MPLPKMPTRPAAILSFPSGEAADAAAAPAEAPSAAPLQPELDGIAPAQARQKTATAKTAAPAGAPAPAAKKTAPRATKAAQPKAAAPAKTPAPSTRTSKSKPAGKTQEAPKLFVLDTNVLLHDPSSLFRFEEHDIFLPMMTLEELDHQKKGMSEVARNARQVSRSLDALVQDTTQLDEGIPLDKLGNKDATGRLRLQTTAIHSTLPSDLPMGKADNQILGVVRALAEKFPQREVTLVSKDINMRLKARALGLAAEDYFNDQVLEDSDLLYSGVMALPESFWNRHGKDVESWQQGGTTFYRIRGPLCAQFVVNQFVYFEGQMPLYAQVREVSGKTAVLATLRDYTHGKNNVWGITARNREQNFAMNLLMNPECDFVSLLGQAGTGKTLLALAAGITQVLETKRYTEIIMTRVTVPVGEDIGFLPGTEEEKMLPWMGALEDNLDVLNMGDGEGNADWGRAATMELIRSRIKVKSLNFMRGRTFLNKYLIIDEAQNLTPKQMKTLITRAGPGTKVVCLGNIAQIDTPYLTEGSSGLTFVVDRFKGWPHAGHVTLQRGERSRLADYAGDVL